MRLHDEDDRGVAFARMLPGPAQRDDETRMAGDRNETDRLRSENESLRDENQTLKDELARMPAIARRCTTERSPSTICQVNS